MSTLEIPLSPTPQTMSISLGGSVYQLTVKWNPAAECWVMDFADVLGNLILAGVAMVTGVDLFGQYGYLGFGGSLVAANEVGAAPPSFDTLGVTAHLLFITP